MDRDHLIIASVGALRQGPQFLYSRVQEQASSEDRVEEVQAIVRVAEELYRLACEAADMARDGHWSDAATVTWLSERAPGHGAEVYDYVLKAAYVDTR